MIKRIFSLMLCAVLVLGLFSGCTPEGGNVNLSVSAVDLNVSATVSGTVSFGEGEADPDVKVNSVVLLYAVTDEQKAALNAIPGSGTGTPGYMTSLSTTGGGSVTASLASSGSASVGLSGTLGEECNDKTVAFRAVVLGTVKDSEGNLQSGYKASGVQTLSIHVRKQCTITVNPVENGTVSVEKTEVYEGDVITVTATPSVGYELDTLTANGETVEGGKFTMPAENVTVAATFKALPTYAIENATTDTNGTVIIDPAGEAYVGQNVTVTATPNRGYARGSITVNDGAVAVTGDKFTMPAENVTVVVAFQQLEARTVSCEFDETMGTVTVDKETAYADEEVTVTATPKAGFQTASVSAKTEGGAAVTVAENKFTMPDANVTVTVVFEAKPTHKITAAAATNGTVTVDKTEAYVGQEVTVTAVPSAGYDLGTITVKDASGKDVTVTNGKFVMPDSDVTVTATFTAKPVFTIENTTTDTNGTVTIDRATAWAGQEVTVTATPAEGYEVDAITVKTTAGADVAVTDGKFVMPASAVTVTVTFKTAHVHSFAPVWKSDSKEHWHECDCGEKTDVAEHTFGSSGKCVVCSFTNEYKITQGANGTWDKKTTTGYTVVSNADYSKFVKVTMDGKDVAASNYTARSGSTSITFKRTYLTNLTVGKHTVKIQSTDGAASTSLNITNKSSTAKTGDDSNLALWLILMLSALIVMTVTMLYDRLKYPYGRPEDKK